MARLKRAKGTTTNSKAKKRSATDRARALKPGKRGRGAINPASPKGHQLRKMGMDSVKAPELFFALVAPVGTDLELAKSVLAEELRTVRYEPIEVRLSHMLRDVADFRKRLDNADKSPEDKRIAAYMDCGDELRRRAQNGAIVAYLAMVYVRLYREEHPIPADFRGRAYIFNSLKHPDEVNDLRKVYGGALIVLSIYSPRAQRIVRLQERITKSRRGLGGKGDSQAAADLVDRDASGGSNEHGQRVAEAFPMADVFVRDAAREELQPEMKRLIEILFQHPYRTPNKDEFGMFHARAVSLRSADLSRQVGAVICAADGAVIGAGCNEVPKAGGGTYWEGDEPDYRDFQQGADANALAKRQLLSELLEKLTAGGWLRKERARLTPEARVDLVARKPDGLFRDTRAFDLLEFSRVVHAEMNALMDAARRGISTQNATMFCTTFPCHLCARHVLSAGIRRVVFIEPYPKSLTSELYGNAVRVDETAADADALQFDAFVGIAPRRYMDCFRAPRHRKDDMGYRIAWKPEVAQPRFQTLVERHKDTETDVAAKVEAVRNQLKLT